LRFQAENTFVASFDRPNLFISLLAKNNAPGQVLDFLAQHEEQSGIIYCATRRTVDDLTGFLHDKGIAARPYHAGLDAGTRQRNQNDFIRDNVRIIVATVAFGMGIDKPDVRFVLHVDLPQDMENYYQQIGRGGRDGLRADCLLLYSRGDVFTIRRFIEQGAATEERGRSLRLEAMVRWAESDMCRRRQLLDYFGETYTNDDCEMCDNCLRGDVEKVDLTVSAQKFLSCAVRTEQIFGANHIINVLRGSQAKAVLDRRHDRVSTYGIGLEHSAEQWKHLSRQFIVQGLLEQDMQFGSLKVTPAGWAVLKGEAQVWGTLAEEQTKQAAAEVLEYDAGLMALLRTTRKELADAANVPPYVVFADRSLMEMATYFPQSTENFAAIHGVGQAKIERYAHIFLPIIRDYCHKHGLAERSRLTTQAPPRNSFRKSRSEEVGERYRDGATMDELMTSYNVKRGTILSHLTRFVQGGETLPVDRLRAESTLSAADQERVHQQFAELGTTALRPVFEALGEQIMYDELHLLRAVYMLEEKVRAG
ncbi:MAG: RecQ family ATP-dependent DNA helicase, partial [Caldilineaceae bacterium]